MKPIALALALVALAACTAAQEETMTKTELKEGMKAPAFTAESTAGPISLEALKGKVVVVYFYPKDATPG